MRFLFSSAFCIQRFEVTFSRKVKQRPISCDKRCTEMACGGNKYPVGRIGMHIKRQAGAGYCDFWFQWYQINSCLCQCLANPIQNILV